MGIYQCLDRLLDEVVHSLVGIIIASTSERLKVVWGKRWLIDKM